MPGNTFSTPDGHIHELLQMKRPPVEGAEVRCRDTGSQCRFPPGRGRWGVKGLQQIGGGFGASVAPEQFPAKEQAYLMDPAGGGDQNGVDDVVQSVTAHHTQGNLRSGQYHRLSQPLQHEGEGGGGIGHGVGAMQHHETVKLVIALGDDPADFVPVLDSNVGGVQQRGKLHQFPVRKLRAMDVVDAAQQRFKDPRLWGYSLFHWGPCRWSRRYK